MYTRIYRPVLEQFLSEHPELSPERTKEIKDHLWSVRAIEDMWTKYSSPKSSEDPGGRHTRFLELLTTGKFPTSCAKEVGIRSSQPWTWRAHSKSFAWSWDAIYLILGRKKPNEPHSWTKEEEDGLMF